MICRACTAGQCEVARASSRLPSSQYEGRRLLARQSSSSSSARRRRPCWGEAYVPAHIGDFLLEWLMHFRSSCDSREETLRDCCNPKFSYWSQVYYLQVLATQEIYSCTYWHVCRMFLYHPGFKVAEGLQNFSFFALSCVFWLGLYQGRCGHLCRSLLKGQYIQRPHGGLCLNCFDSTEIHKITTGPSLLQTRCTEEEEEVFCWMRMVQTLQADTY